MRLHSRRATLAVVLTLSVTSWMAPMAAAAQTSTVPAARAVPQITQRIDESALTTLQGSMHPLARPQFDRGILPDSTPAKRMLLVLRRSPGSEAALRQYVEDIHNSASGSYHHWLTPADLGTLYGPADADTQQIVGWLTAHGFSVDKIHSSKTVIEFSGTTGQLRNAFHTEIHQYLVGGELHMANSSDPQIPTALAPVIAGIASLNDFHAKPNLVKKGTAVYTPSTKGVQPLWSDPASGGGVYLALAPGDFKVQYDVPSSATGAGYTIGIIGASNVDVGLVNQYRSVFGLPANPLQVIVDGNDPGQNGADVESYLDVEAAGSVAPNATVILYTSADSELTDGLYTAALRAVNDDTADVLSMSYGTCEAYLGTATNQFFNALWQQAAAQGQTVMVSAGDGGAAGCDDFDIEYSAEFGIAVNGFASTPYNIAVGGTDFYYNDYNQSSSLNAQINSYWNTTSSLTPTISLLKTIPEQPWNVPLGLNTDGASGFGIVAGSGGPSKVYAKPKWQSGTGVPTDGVRDLPDVSLFASNGYNYSFWPICAVTTDCSTTGSTTGAVNITGIGGTSASSPAFAGIMALVDQATKSRQGQANTVIYPLAAQSPSVFHDVTAGSNKVPCELISGDTGCAFDLTFGTDDLGYSATTGYDLASGLGSVDVAALINSWNLVSFKATSTTLSLGSSSITHGQSVTVQSSVAPTSGSGTPTGAVALTSKVTGATSSTGLGSLALTNGSASTTLQSLPGGTYTVFADYSGDSTYAPSVSSGSSLTVLPEASIISYPAAELKAYNNASIGYGVPLGIYVQVVPSSGSANGVPTGVVTFTDSAGGQWQFPLNASGVAEWDPSSLALGTHTITAAYAGDASFKAATTPVSLTFTIVKATPYIGVAAAPYYVTAGGSLTVTVGVSNEYLGDTAITIAAPTGSVLLTLGTQQQTVNLSQASGTGYGTTTFTNLAAGTYYLNATYSGDPNWNRASASPTLVDVVTVNPYLTSTTTLTSSPSTLTGANGQVLLTATVNGNGVILPSGIIEFFVGGQLFAEGYATAAGTTGTAATTGVAQVYVPGYYLPNGTDSLVALYTGSSYYNSSISSATTLTVNAADFAINAATPAVSLNPGSTATANFNLTSSGFSGAVTITCTTSSTAVLCTPPSSSPTLTASGQASFAVTVLAANMAHNSLPSKGILPYYGGGLALACVLLLGVPRCRRNRPITLASLLLLTAGFATSCSSSGGAGATTTVTPVNASPATYSVLVTATGGGVTHTARLTVNVL